MNFIFNHDWVRNHSKNFGIKIDAIRKARNGGNHIPDRPPMAPKKEMQPQNNTVERNNGFSFGNKDRINDGVVEDNYRKKNIEMQEYRDRENREKREMEYNTYRQQNSGKGGLYDEKNTMKKNGYGGSAKGNRDRNKQKSQKIV